MTADSLARWIGEVVRKRDDASLVLTVPAPPDAVELALETLPAAYSFLWDPGGERVWVGGDAALLLEEGCEAETEAGGGGQADRFVRLRRRSEALFRQVESVTHPACPEYVPRLFGGLAFTSGGARSVPWCEFGDGCFTLPRWLYSGGTDSASLSLTLAPVDRHGRRLERWIEELARILGALSGPRPKVVHGGTSPAVAIAGSLSRSDLQDWCEHVRRVREAIVGGRCEKVVLARRLELELGTPLSPNRLLAYLDRNGRGSFRFAFRRPQAAFLGTTPERLIARRGRRIRTEALAGSSGGGEDHARRLLDSAKDRVEHSLVVRHLVSSLEPLCRCLEWSPKPRIRTLRHLQHLETPLDGELRRDVHVLDLVAALHPTPAVGGVPTAEAMRKIAEHEAVERGWYSGPVGWLDAHGDGEFAVALRSCVLHGDRAYLWAGAGLVADSDPVAEYEETVLKLTGIVGALEAALDDGVEEDPGGAARSSDGVARSTAEEAVMERAAAGKR